MARQKRTQVTDVWPVLESAGRAPEGWKGWPGNNRFALVLTHDVESQRGLDRCRTIMDLEERLGFRSAFYFVPGRYTVPVDLRAEMKQRGFEVAVHGLHHDLSLFKSRKEFDRQAIEINRYLRDWGANGFRCPYMIRNLEWMRDALDIDYDSSTFDTDPFEPQPEGAGTIFPFIVDGGQRGGRDFVELPCTLPQDLTLFVLLGETGVGVWKTKLDWIASRGGMALFDTHPDYMQAGGDFASDEYPLRYYEQFLEYVRTCYKGHYWHAIPTDVAIYSKNAGITRIADAPGPASDLDPAPGGNRSPAGGCGKETVIWIDLDNTPHVPFFKPIIAELRQRGHKVTVTARDAFQVCDLAVKMGVQCQRIGRHYGKNRLMKVAGLFYRAMQMIPLVISAKPVLAVSHGSRSQIILANLLRIPSVLIEDYEFARFPLFMRPTWRIIPEIIPCDTLGSEHARVMTYPGIKEDVYVPGFIPDPHILTEIHASENDIIVTVRPPATEAHYHNPESERLFAAVMARLQSMPMVRTVLLPRNQKQGEEIKKEWETYFSTGRVLIPGSALNGLNLIWFSDVVVSGGGTMNREAASLGVPVYSTFRGTIGAVDRHLEQTGKLTMLSSVTDVHDKLRICKRQRPSCSTTGDSETFTRIIACIENCLP